MNVLITRNTAVKGDSCVICFQIAQPKSFANICNFYTVANKTEYTKT